MTIIDYGIILAAVLAVTLLCGLASLAVGKLQNKATESTVEGQSTADKSEIKIHAEVPVTDPMEMAKLPELGDSSTLPDDAKSVLMNAVWYRCENPKCNYTQFLDVYHIVSIEKGGSNALENLVVLCPECRNNAAGGQIDLDVLRAWTNGRVEKFKFALEWPYK